MLHLVVAAAFEDVHEADQVAVHVGVRILDRVAHAGLGGKVDDAIEFLVGEQLLDARTVGDVELDEAEVGMRLQLRQTCFLERDFVVVVEVVDADHFVAARQQAQGGAHADKPGGAGDENFHVQDPARESRDFTAAQQSRSCAPASWNIS